MLSVVGDGQKTEIHKTDRSEYRQNELAMDEGGESLIPLDLIHFNGEENQQRYQQTEKDKLNDHHQSEYSMHIMFAEPASNEDTEREDGDTDEGQHEQNRGQLWKGNWSHFENTRQSSEQCNEK